MTARRRLGRSVDAIAARALGAMARLDRGRPDVVAVLTYHRVVDGTTLAAPGSVSADPASFERQIAMLARDYHPISIDDLVRRRDGGPALPRRSVLVTIDDAYRDVADVAWPALRRHGVPAVLFVPTAYPDGGASFWWDRLHAAIRAAPALDRWATPAGALPLSTSAARDDAYRRLRGIVKVLPHDEATALVDTLVADLAGRAGSSTEQPAAAPPTAASPILGWDDLRALAAEGLGLAPHSRRHPLLTRVADGELDDEVGGSREDLAARLGGPPAAAFAYPSGAHSARVRDAVERHGFRIAFTTERGLNDLASPTDWLAVRRINVGRRTDESAIRAQLDRRLGPLLAAVARRERRRAAPGRATDPVVSSHG